MLERILAFSIRRRWLVLIATLAIAALGVVSYERLPIDAVPDITNVQVQINAEAPGYSPLEAETRVTFPIETAMGGLPALEYTRSLSRYGLSQVTVIFKDGTDIYFARQLVFQRLAEVEDSIPSGVDVGMGPVSTAMGEIYQYTLEGPEPEEAEANRRYLTELRTIQDWLVSPLLKGVRGVNEVGLRRSGCRRS